MWAHYDFFTGIGGFHLACKNYEKFETVMASEIDSYNCKLIDQKMGLDNAGDIRNFGISEEFHPDFAFYNDNETDTVSVEKTGFSTVTYQDFMEGVLEMPFVVTGGFPCLEITPANVHCTSGIKGENSGLVEQQLDFIEDFEPPFAMFENSERLNVRGLDEILKRLSKIGYIVEWETVSATAFLYPHYRHRIFICAYLPSTNVARLNERMFDHMRMKASYLQDKPFKFPLMNENSQWVKDNAVVENTRSIKLRTKRINSLGNALIKDIPECLFHSINHFESKELDESINNQFSTNELHCLSLNGVSWECTKTNEVTSKMPSRGIMVGEKIFSSGNCPILNVSKRQFEGLYSTLISRDGNNNFTTKSRLNRPGKLGGVIGDIMRLGVDKGGLHPNFCELLMGYDNDWTKLECKVA